METSVHRLQSKTFPVASGSTWLERKENTIMETADEAGFFYLPLSVTSNAIIICPIMNKTPLNLYPNKE